MSAEPVAAATTTTNKPVIEERIYIGNVDFKATEEELKELFEDLKVTEVEIPFKEHTGSKNKTYKRHLGFAFVQFESKEEADKAIEQFNGKKFQRRIIFIKKAVPPPTEEEKKERIEAYKVKREAFLKEKEEKKAKAEAAKKEAAASKTAKAANDEPKDKVPEGKPSADTIFVTNLDYKVDVKTLNVLFKELKPKWIHVPTRRIPLHILKKKGRKTVFNKGIAFVKFTNEETQKKAVAEYNGKELNGREIIVDIAIDARIPAAAEAEAEAEAQAEAAAEVEADAEVEATTETPAETPVEAVENGEKASPEDEEAN